MPSKSIQLTAEELQAVTAVAAKYKISVVKRLKGWIAPHLEQDVRTFRADRWAARRQVLKANSTLADLVDGST